MTGAKRIFRTEEASDGIIVDLEKQMEIATNGFIHVEKKLTDEERARIEKPRIEQILDLNESRWNDDYAANSLLRKRFRTETKRISETMNPNMDLNLKTLTSEDQLRSKQAIFKNKD